MLPPPPASSPCTHEAGSPWHLLPLSLGPQQDPGLALHSSLGVGSRADLPGRCPLAVHSVGRWAQEELERRVPHPLRPTAFQDTCPVLGRLNFVVLFEPTVTYSPLVPRSGSGPVGAFCGGVSGEGTYCCLLQCLPTNPLTSVLSLPGKPKVSSTNGFPGSLAHRLEPNFSTSFS